MGIPQRSLHPVDVIKTELVGGFAHDIIEAVPPDVALWLFTSGIHLDDERLARWRTRVCGYVVSLDGTSTRHDWLRRRATSFDENSDPVAERA